MIRDKPRYEPKLGRTFTNNAILRVLSSISGTDGNTRPKSVPEIVKQLHIPTNTGYRAINALLSHGLIREAGKEETCNNNRNVLIQVWKPTPAGHVILSILKDNFWAFIHVSTNEIRYVHPKTLEIKAVKI